MPAQVAAQLAWKEILKHLPAVIETAREIWERWNSRRRSPVDQDAEPIVQIKSILERIDYLEDAEVKQAYLIRQISEQLQGISDGLEEVSRRIIIAHWLATAASCVSCAALLLFLLR